MSRPRVLIEQWLPIDQIGAECMRERGASSALPPLYFLHVWWARRPLTVSRAAILASLLPGYPVDDDDNVRGWPKAFLKRFPTFDAYKQWFLALLGVKGNSAAARKLLESSKLRGQKIANPYEGPRAFTVNPSEEQMETLYDLLEWTWGTREIKFCDPMSGGGSIPFEALRFGLTVHANELNPVANVILRATLNYPARFGSSLVSDIRKFGELWVERVQTRLKDFYTELPGDAIGACYVWARTVACPSTGKQVPLSPNWWLRKGADPVAVKLLSEPSYDRCRFEIVHGTAACARVKPDQGTIKGGTGVSPWNREVIDGDYIKAEAQAGRMGQQLFGVGVKKKGDFSFRAPTAEDEVAFSRAVKELRKQRIAWESADLLPTEQRYIGPSDRLANYGQLLFTDVFGPRQLLSLGIAVEELRRVRQSIEHAFTNDPLRAEAIVAYLAITLDKAIDYNSRQAVWHPGRSVIAHTFTRHDFRFKWSHSEFDASRNLLPWALKQVVDSYAGIGELLPNSQEQRSLSLFGGSATSPAEKLRITQGSAANLSTVPDGSVTLVCIDPPYYDNVIYSECADFFYVWLKRTFFNSETTTAVDELTNKDDEAVANWARFRDFPKKKKQLARQDYERKMVSAFSEIYRVLHHDGVLAVMFTHKEVEAWDTLGTALIESGFEIDSSWPVHTENEHSLHQAKKNAAASTILLICRKRDKSTKHVWWDDLKGKVRTAARQKAAEFEKQGIRGVDLYISTFGPVLSIISESWPVLTSETDPKTGDPLPLKPGDALDLAREEVINLRKQGLLLGRTVEFDPITDWYLMAWDAFRAQEFPADEARKLALALGLDLERDIIRDKKLVAKKSGTVVMSKPTDRRKKNMVDDDAESFPHLIDALHTAMMIYEEEGSKACQVFVDRQGLRNDSRIKALVQAIMEAIPTTRGKDDKFIRPEMTTLDAMRILLWEDLPAPKEEEIPKLDPQRALFEMDGEAAQGDEDEEELDDEEENDE